MSSRKGIVLAGGHGSRLRPLTSGLSKQLMPVYDKPMIYYPLSLVMQAGIREILIITTPRDRAMFQQLLGDGTQWGVALEYAVQEEPGGIAQAFLIGREFVGDQPVCLTLGDNIFYSEHLSQRLASASRRRRATIFGYWVSHPERYGVVTLDSDGQALRIEEKPDRPRSHYAVTGLYFYGPEVVAVAEGLRPSARGELEITDVNQTLLERGELEVEILSRGTTWLDAGTHESLLDAANFVRLVEERQGRKIGCPEEVAYQMRYIDDAQLQSLATAMGANGYGDYLRSVLADGAGSAR